MNIILTSKLTSQIEAHKYTKEEFKRDFYDLISGYQSDFFGWNVPDTKHPNLYHVHIIPDESDPKRNIWIKNKNHHQRKSDNILFYASNNKGSYLCILLVKPNGHATFNNIDAMAGLAKITDNFVNFNLVP
jgi:hypothetical protein